MELLSPAKSFRLGGCYLEITSNCNLRCLHCYNESGVLQDQIDMPTFMSIINDLPDHPDTSITISGENRLRILCSGISWRRCRRSSSVWCW